ncbi:MAG: hypothetical protein HC818_04410 [Synechococcaceae cyanobacterium RM1_1_27]|nr:hypothetical protein [Synechococcaceae cyanobacterium RM1_1_27]
MKCWDPDFPQLTTIKTSSLGSPPPPMVNTQLIDGLVQTLLALSVKEQEVLFQRLEQPKPATPFKTNYTNTKAQYGLSSQDFYAQFMSGSLGDAEDYIEWAGFYEMLQLIPDIAA